MRVNPTVEGVPALATASTAPTLSLHFARSPDGTTYIDHQLARYPCHVCRVLRFPVDPPGMATVYVQSASGGLYEGDRLSVEMNLREGASAHVTTQASTIVHATRGGEASQEVALRVASNALIEYLPDPVILFPDARLRSTVRVSVAAGGAAIIGESYLGHDPEGLGRPFSSLASDVSVAGDSGETLLRDRFMVAGTAGQPVPIMQREGFRAHGSLLCFGFRDHNARILEEVRRALDLVEDSEGDIYAGVSTLPGEHGVWIRALARDGACLRRGMQTAWTALRQATTGMAPQIRQK